MLNFPSACFDLLPFLVLTESKKDDTARTHKICSQTDIGNHHLNLEKITTGSRDMGTMCQQTWATLKTHTQQEHTRNAATQKYPNMGKFTSGSRDISRMCQQTWVTPKHMNYALFWLINFTFKPNEVAESNYLYVAIREVYRISTKVC